MAKKTNNIIIDVMPGNSKAKRHSFSWKNTLKNRVAQVLAIIIVVIVVGTGLAIHSHRSKTTDPSGQSLINDTVNKVGKLILLPTGEQPTLAVVNDASKYNNVAFFKNAANGDRLLVYAQAHEAILYRPSINKIIAVAPLNATAQ